MKSVLLIVALAAASIPIISAAPALACGMEPAAMKGKPADLLVRAVNDIRDGQYGSASRAAKSVTRDKNATKNEKAQGWALIGFLRFKNGSKDSAIAALKEAKKLDEAAIPVLIEKVSFEKGDKALGVEIKKALEV